MNVKELKEVINSLPDDMEIILQKDSEGNGFSPLAGTDSNAVYVPESSYSGEVYLLEWTANDCCMDKKEWNEIKNKPNSLILYPVN